MPSKLEPVLIGVLISDGHLKKNVKGYTYLYLKQSPKNFKYLWFVFTKFTYYCSSYPFISYTTVRGKLFYGIFFFNKIFPFF